MDPSLVLLLVLCIFLKIVSSLLWKVLQELLLIPVVDLCLVVLLRAFLLEVVLLILLAEAGTQNLDRLLLSIRQVGLFEKLVVLFKL